MQQENVGILLDYSEAMGPTLACALRSIAARQMNGITSVLEACHVAIHPHAAICYHAIKMILVVHSDASYLSEPDSKIHMRGHYFLTDNNSNAPNNGTILILAAIIRYVVPSTSEANFAAITNVEMLCHCGKHSRKRVTTSLNLL